MIKKNSLIDQDLFQTLINIQEKLNSPIFNGGFETVVSAIEDIRESGRKTEEFVENINKTIYEPDEGLFSRIKTVEQQSNDKDQEIRLKITETNNSILSRLNSLEKSRDFWNKLFWVLVPAFAGMFFKVCYDVISTHVMIK